VGLALGQPNDGMALLFRALRSWPLQQDVMPARPCHQSPRNLEAVGTLDDRITEATCLTRPAPPPGKAARGNAEKSVAICAAGDGRMTGARMNEPEAVCGKVGAKSLPNAVKPAATSAYWLAVKPFGGRHRSGPSRPVPLLQEKRSRILKLIAHRGWSSGAGENTLAALRRAAAEPGVSGVELDLRRADDGRLAISHDRPQPGAATFDEVVRFISGTRFDAFVELKEPGLALEAVRKLATGGLAGRSVVFGPDELLQKMDGERPVALGIIAAYPWQIPRLAAAFSPDVILLGWDERAWTRLAFRAWWSVFSLRRMGQRYSAEVVVGVARRASDVRWLRRQGIDAAVIDMAAIGAPGQALK